jgi:Tfp pilus assembly protein PilW
MSIFLVVLMGIYLTYDTSQTTFTSGSRDIDLQDSGRKAAEEMARLLRMAGYDPTGAGRFGFRTVTAHATFAPGGFTPIATNNQILFSMDADGDGNVDDNTSERVGFRLSGNQIEKTNTAGTAAIAGIPVLARNVQSLRFRYFTAADAEINPACPPTCTYTLTDAQRQTIRRVTIVLTLQIAATIPGQITRVYTMSTDVRSRNL